MQSGTPNMAHMSLPACTRRQVGWFVTMSKQLRAIFGQQNSLPSVLIIRVPEGALRFSNSALCTALAGAGPLEGRIG